MVPRLEINWGGLGYPTYEVEMKVSGKENTAYDAQSQMSTSLMSMMNTQFGEMQGLLNNFLIPQLKQMVTDPTGFGAKALAAMKSATIQTIGTQLASQQRTLQNQFATQNMAGLGSGVEMGLSSSLASTAAGQEASNLQQLTIADAQARMQQQQFGVQGLMGATQMLGAAPQAAALANQSVGAQFSEAYNMAQQGGFWSNLARGALTATGAALGGVAGGPWGAMAGANIGSNIGGGVFGGSGGAPLQVQG